MDWFVDVAERGAELGFVQAGKTRHHLDPHKVVGGEVEAVEDGIESSQDGASGIRVQVVGH